MFNIGPVCISRTKIIRSNKNQKIASIKNCFASYVRIKRNQNISRKPQMSFKILVARVPVVTSIYISLEKNAASRYFSYVLLISFFLTSARY